MSNGLTHPEVNVSLLMSLYANKSLIHYFVYSIITYFKDIVKMTKFMRRLAGNNFVTLFLALSFFYGLSFSKSNYINKILIKEENLNSSKDSKKECETRTSETSRDKIKI